jgi:hypothetical protein
MENCYKLVRKFKNKYPLTIAWRLRQHSEVIQEHMNPGEKILYVFAGQKNDSPLDIVNTNIVALTDKRIMVATKRLVFGYFFKSITPDMYDDLTVNKGMIFGTVVIDTIKEVIKITNIDPAALNEIETNITEIMLKQKKELARRERENKNEK